MIDYDNWSKRFAATLKEPKSSDELTKAFSMMMHPVQARTVADKVVEEYNLFHQTVDESHS